MAKHWIQKAINPEHRGMLRQELGLNSKGRIPKKALEQAAEKGGELGKRANLALTLEELRKKNK